MGRKGMSCERTFQAMGEPAELEAKAWLSDQCCCMWCNWVETHSRVWHAGLLAVSAGVVPDTSADRCMLAGLVCLPRLACEHPPDEVCMHVQCAELSEKLAEDLASEGLKGKTITLKLKETNFEVRTRNITLTRHISSREDVLHEALKLLRAELPITIRLMVRHLGCLRCTITCMNLPLTAAVPGWQETRAAAASLLCQLLMLAGLLCTDTLRPSILLAVPIGAAPVGK